MRRLVAFILAGLFLAGLTLLGWYAVRGRTTAGAGAAPVLAGRLGGHVAPIARAYPPAVPPEAPGGQMGEFRRMYRVPAGRLLVDLLADGRVRQLTLGRERAVADTWDPDPGDWLLAEARRLAVDWLPRDATLLREEPFLFQGRAAGRRDVYRSAALAAALSELDYQQAAASGPPGLCAITYYLTSAERVAFLLVGLYETRG